MTCEIPYRFYGGNREAILCKAREVIVSGPAETGKTLALLFLVHTLAYKHAGAHLSIIRKKKVDLTGTVIRTFRRDFIDAGYAPGVTWYGCEYPQWYDYPNGSRIWLGGIDDPGKTLSAERDLIYVNQAEELNLSDWEYLTRCVTGRGAVMPNTRLVGDCNPSSPTHWILVRERDGKLAKFDTTHKDNPTLWDHESGEWTEQGKRSLKVLSNLTGVRLLRLFHGLWAAPEGQIYSIFSEEKHVVKAFDPPLLWPRAVGIDPFGPYTAAVWLAFDLDNGKLNVYREYLEPFGLTVKGHSENMLRLSKGETIWRWVCGAKSERSWRLEYQASGIPVTEPPIVDVWLGIDRVYQLLSDWSLVVHDNCVNLLSEIGNYRRKLDRGGNPTEAIESKEDFHLLDALRYVVAELTQPATTEEVISLIRPI